MPAVAPASMHRRQRQQSAPPPADHSTSVTLHFKERNNPKQPLYRPAALRRNGSVSRDLFAHPSPPHSPSIAVTESRSSSWLNSLAGPFSPSAASANDASNKELGATSGVAAVVRGYMIPRSQWKADDSADQCADPDCSQRFDLMHRRHHCRTCGDIYCSAHSSRSTFLWPSAEDDAVPAFTPRATPRSTPRSSAVDLPSLVNSALSNNLNLNASAISTGSNGSSASADTSTPTSSPPRNQPVVMPISARVCDRCYFSAPSGSAGGAPLLLPPNYAGVSPPTYADGGSFASAASAFALSARPLTTFNLRHPPSRASSASASRASSPNNSPPGGSSGHLSRQASHSRSRQRQRQGSAVSASSSSHSTSFPSDSTNATPSTPSTSVEGAADPPTAASSCGSTASSTNGTSPEMLQMASHHARGGAPPVAAALAAGAVAASTNRRGSSLGRNAGSKRTLCSGTVATPKIVHEGEVLSSYETETDERRNKSAAAAGAGAGGEVGGGGGVGAKLAAVQRRRPQSQPARVSAAVNDGSMWVPTTRYRSASNDPEGGNSSSSGSSSTDGDHRPPLASRRPQKQSQPPKPKGKAADASRYYVESDSSSVSDDSDDDENDERHERVVRERRLYQQEYGSVQGGPWQSWATF
ncbi:hypothetical protein JCM8115_001632 [Rhodotorula mucilaginosa]|uniref:FYVE zinc finger domain-containing protein n=1 Tax=Rhodotorula mucilaginosa TaxID=5537 RepID=A0A9P6VXE4_RHOMI|nr:hypothetical protein C6P46_006236 [Rhodotorula mucilaginosa]